MSPENRAVGPVDSEQGQQFVCIGDVKELRMRAECSWAGKVSICPQDCPVSRRVSETSPGRGNISSLCTASFFFSFPMPQ